MTDRRRIITLAVFTGFLLAAYDTRVITAIPWQSIYQDDTPASIPEHTSISDDTFDHLDRSGRLRSLFGREGSARLDLVDLNASHFRHDQLYGIEAYGDDPETEVEERTLPPPGLFAGLPDYSYAIYDWINKNRTCPAFNSPGYTADCHEFIGWLGALNSVHFGSQAREMYAHLHTSALDLAHRAREMREAMSPLEREVYEDEIREAELLALAYEGYAQHFLQDRWAIGHMWERWNAPDTTQEPAALSSHLAIGALAGLIHGAEAVVGNTPYLETLLMRADPMSSPLPGADGIAQPMEYRHVRADGSMSAPLPGTGDERYYDMVEGRFNLNRYDDSRDNQTLNVAAQMRSMRECAGAGWAEVIRALGPGDRGGYGAYDAPMDAGAPSFPVLDREDCWNAWATNRSMMIGLLGPNPARSVSLLATLDFATPRFDGVGSADNNPLVSDRTELVAYATRLWMYGRDDPDGTTVSRGQMTSLAGQLGDLVGWGEAFDPNTLWGFQAGSAYGLPNYVAPVALATDAPTGATPPLPRRDNRGRDIQTFYGYFNGANSDYWCENNDIFAELRDSPTPLNQEMCEHLAQRIFQGTHPVYRGAQAMSREQDGQAVRSICQIRETSGVESDSEDDRLNPYWLDQGYVPASARQTPEPVFTEFEAVTNWCARMPILALPEDADLRDANIVARIAPDTDQLRLTGWDFGDEPGSISLTDTLGTETIELTAITRWTDTDITIDLDGLSLENGTRYQIALSPAPGSQAWLRPDLAGLYYIDVQTPPERQLRRLDLTGLGPCMDPVQSFALTDLDSFFNGAFMPSAYTGFADAFARDARALQAYLSGQLACMQSLHTAAQPILVQDASDAMVAVSSRQGRFRTDGHGVAYAHVLNTLEGETETVANQYLSRYIREVQGLIWTLDRSANLVEAWELALNGDTVLSRDPNLGITDLLARATSPAATIEIGFTDEFANMVPAGLPPEATQALRDVQTLMLEEQIRLDLRRVNQTVHTASGTVLAGLPHWTQIHQTLVNDALPQHRELGDAFSAEVGAALARAIADGGLESCRETGEDPCTLFSGPVDSSAYDRSVGWISGMFPTTIPILLRSGGDMLDYVDASGERHGFIEWPSAEQADRARRGP